MLERVVPLPARAVGERGRVNAHVVAEHFLDRILADRLDDRKQSVRPVRRLAGEDVEHVATGLFRLVRVARHEFDTHASLTHRLERLHPPVQPVGSDGDRVAAGHDPATGTDGLLDEPLTGNATIRSDDRTDRAGGSVIQGVDSGIHKPTGEGTTSPGGGLQGQLGWQWERRQRAGTSRLNRPRASVSMVT